MPNHDKIEMPKFVFTACNLKRGKQKRFSSKKKVNQAKKIFEFIIQSVFKEVALDATYFFLGNKVKHEIQTDV